MVGPEDLGCCSLQGQVYQSAARCMNLGFAKVLCEVQGKPKCTLLQGVGFTPKRSSSASGAAAAAARRGAKGSSTLRKGREHL